MSGAERDEYEAFMVRFNSSGGVAGINVEGKRAKLVSIVVKNRRQRMFKGPSDVLALGDLDADGLDRLIKVVDAPVRHRRRGAGCRQGDFYRRPERFFWHRLARDLGMTVEQAQRRIASPAFTDWMAFYVVEAELNGTIEREPTADELGDKIRATFTALKAPKRRRPASGRRRRAAGHPRRQ
jgi:hypothetical protein